jgi:hypothetical protein
MATTKESNMKDDRRYMTFEERAIDDPRYRGKIKEREEGTVTCRCGKTVYRYNGSAVSAECPRNCEAGR